MLPAFNLHDLILKAYNSKHTTEVLVLNNIHVLISKQNILFFILLNITIVYVLTPSIWRNSTLVLQMRGTIFPKKYSMICVVHLQRNEARATCYIHPRVNFFSDISQSELLPLSPLSLLSCPEIFPMFADPG